MEKYGGNLPKKAVRKRATTIGDVAAAQDTARVKAQVKRVRKTTVKVDTRDILKAVPASERQRVSNVVVVKPKGAKHKVTVSTGDILQGVKGVPAAKPAPAKRPSFGQALKQELEGRGAIAEALSRASGPVAHSLIREPEPLRYKGKPVKNADTSGIPGVNTKLGPFATRAVKDLVNFPAAAIPSVYVPAAAAVEAAKGDTSRGRKLLHDLPHTDPAAALVTGHPGRALKLADEHPGFTALEAFGVKGAIGRGAGRVMRAAPKTSRVHQLASTVRPDRTVPGTTLAHKQSYSPDVGRKAVQVANERRLAKRAAAIHAKGVKRQDPELLANARKLDPTRMTDAQIRKRVDERVAANETIRRHNRTAAVEEAHRAITNTATPTGSPARRVTMIAHNRKTKTTPTAATTLRAQAITSATPKDLRAYRDELAAQHDALGPSQALANRTLRKQINKAIAANPDPVALKGAAERYAQVIVPRQAALVAHGLLDSEQVAKAPLVPYAVRHMGATHGKPEAPPTAPNPVRVAKAQRARASRALEVAQRKAAREQGRTTLLVQQRHGRDLTKAKMLTQQAAGLDEQATRLVALSRKNTMGKRATDPLADIGVLTKAQRRYRHKAARTGVRKQGVQVGSQGYRTGQRQARRAQEIRQRAESLRAEAEAIRTTPVGETNRPIPALTRLERAQADVLAAEHAHEGTRQAVKIAKAQHRAVKARRATPELLDRHGKPLPADEIRAHMARSGVKEPVYVTQAPGQRGAKNFFVSSGRPPQAATGTRTGAATTKGTLDAHPDVLLEGAAKMQGLIDAADGYTATVHEFAHKPTLGHLKTKREADQAARDLNASTGANWRPVRIHPFGAGNAQLKALLDKTAGEGDLGENVGAAQPVREALDAAVKGHDGPGPWALMPDAAAHQFAQHLHNLGVGPKAKALQVAGSGFRRTVLATSPTWMTGNVTEAALRSALGRAGPRSYVTGRRAVKRLQEIDPAAAQQLTARATGGGHYSMADRQHIRRDSTQFTGSTVLEPLARGLGAFWRAPGPKHVADAWHAWTDLVFRQVNGRIESHFQTAMLGKALRDSPLMSDHVRKLSQEAIDQAARGLRDTNEQARFAREVERMYGKYSAFSPDMRWAIATYTPFVAWTLNAVKFVSVVLPVDHPAATALIASAELQTEQWRKDHGLDLFMKGALPGFLQGSIPLSGGRHQRAPFRYTPFGAFADPLDTAASAVLPQFTGVLSAFKGEDWKGAKLRNPDGSPADLFTKAKAAAASFIDATVPIVAQAKRIGDKGIGALNPVAPIAPKKPKVRKAAGGSARTSEQDINALLNSDPTQRDIDALLNQIP